MVQGPGLGVTVKTGGLSKEDTQTRYRFSARGIIDENGMLRWLVPEELQPLESVISIPMGDEASTIPRKRLGVSSFSKAMVSIIVWDVEFWITFFFYC